MVSRLLVVLLGTASLLCAFESSNIQLLYAEGFKGDSFAYDTQDGHKTTLTFEHFRTHALGDLFMFIDYTDGAHCRFDAGECVERRTDHTLYSEISPRLSLSSMSGYDLSHGVVRDLYLSAQYNTGHDFVAYLIGVGADFT